MWSILQNFFSTGNYMPHGHCYLWQTDLVWLHVVSDSLIALAYYFIPIVLAIFVYKRPDLPFKRIFLLFVIFIVTCGTTHVMAVWTLWYSHYWISGLIKAITALVSVLTAIILIPLMPKALALPSPAQLEQDKQTLQNEIIERKRAEQELQQSEEQLRAKNEQLSRTLQELQRTQSQLIQGEEIKVVMSAISQGDFKQRINIKEKEGLLKTFGEIINQTLDLNLQIIEDLTRVFAALARGDLTQTITKNYHGTLGQLKNDVNTTVTQLTEVIDTIQQAAEAVTQVTENILQGSLNLSHRTEQQAASLQQTAASMEQMTSIVQQTVENARQATGMAMSAHELAQQGGNVVGKAVAAMTDINQSSQRITDIIGVIDNIAFQTNLLALNAAVEAARAGEQGRGFAVVATEVRQLAQRSAQAAKEIKGLIQESVDKVEEGARLVNQSGTTLKDIVMAVKKVSEIIAEIAAADEEQSSGINQVNQVLTQMDHLTQKNAELVQQLTSVSQSMSEQVQYLEEGIAFFNTGKNGISERKMPKSRAAASEKLPQKKPETSRPLGSSHQTTRLGDEWEYF